MVFFIDFYIDDIVGLLLPVGRPGSSGGGPPFVWSGEYLFELPELVCADCFLLSEGLSCRQGKGQTYYQQCKTSQLEKVFTGMFNGAHRSGPQGLLGMFADPGKQWDRAGKGVLLKQGNFS